MVPFGLMWVQFKDRQGGLDTVVRETVDSLVSQGGLVSLASQVSVASRVGLGTAALVGILDLVVSQGGLVIAATRGIVAIQVSVAIRDQVFLVTQAHLAIRESLGLVAILDRTVS